MTEESTDNNIIKNDKNTIDKENENIINETKEIKTESTIEQGSEVQVVHQSPVDPNLNYQNQPGYYQNQPMYYQNQQGYYQGPPVSVQQQGYGNPPYQEYTNQMYYQGYTGQPTYNDGKIQYGQTTYNEGQAPSYIDQSHPYYASQMQQQQQAQVPPETSAPPKQIVLFQPTEEQVKKLKMRLRSKYKATLPFDWLGQDSTEWYTSWALTQKNCVAFKIFVTGYAYWSWCKFSDRFFSDTWNCDMERILDVTVILRFGFVWLAFLSVMLGVGGVTLLSLLKLLLSKESFKKLSDFKVGRLFLSKWRSWAVIGMNHHYDVATLMACMPLVLLVATPNFFELNFRPSILPSVTLPILVLTDYWLSKRVRFNGTYSRRYIFLTIIILGIIGLIWSFLHYFFIRAALIIYTQQSLFTVFLPTILLTFAFLSVATIGTDALYNFTRFKAHYLLSNHFKSLSPRDVDQISKENQEHYDQKNKAKQAIYLAQLEAYNAEMNAKYPGIDLNLNNINFNENNNTQIIQSEDVSDSVVPESSTGESSVVVNESIENVPVAVVPQ